MPIRKSPMKGSPMLFSARKMKRAGRRILNTLGYETVRTESGIALRKRRAIGSDPLADISSIAGGADKLAVIIDGGGHQGESALLYADVFPGATVFSFEPEKSNFRTLCGNVSSCGRIVPVKLALGEETGTETFVVTADSQTGSLLSPAPGSGRYVQDPRSVQRTSTESVNVAALSDWVQKNDVGAIDLLKLDLQGYELKALKGARSLLSGGRILFLYLEVNFVAAYEGQATLTELYDYCTGSGYRLVGLYPSEFDGRQFHYRCGGDVLFVLEDLKRFDRTGRYSAGTAA